MATPARVKVKLSAEVENFRQAMQMAADCSPMVAEYFGEPTPIHDNLKADVLRNQMADDLEADALDPTLGWWRRSILRREARDMRGGVL